jgi:hypothetical protein
MCSSTFQQQPFTNNITRIPTFYWEILATSIVLGRGWTQNYYYAYVVLLWPILSAEYCTDCKCFFFTKVTTRPADQHSADKISVNSSHSCGLMKNYSVAPSFGRYNSPIQSVRLRIYL